MNDVERTIEDVTNSVDPVLRWFLVWASEGYPVDVNGEQRYIDAGSVILASRSAHGLVLVQDTPYAPFMASSQALPLEGIKRVNVTIVKMSDVKVPAPGHIRDALSKLFC